MPAPASAGPSSQPAAPQAVQPKKKDRRNWDKVVDDELVEDKDADKDPVSAARALAASDADNRTLAATQR
jgi:hypothetical protein